MIELNEQDFCMKTFSKICTAATIFFLLITPVLQAQDLYSPENITIVDLTFEQDNWDTILDNLYSAGDEERLIASATVNGKLFDSVGVRYKGNSSYNRNNKKNPLNIKLDHVIDQDYHGFGTLKLSNIDKDPSCVREVVSYEIARNYMPASQANFAKVSINGDYMGVFTSVQSVDKYFANTHFGDNENPFFKGEIIGGGGMPSDSDPIWGYTTNDSSNYTSLYELRSDEGWGEFLNFLEIFNNQPDQIEEVLNVDRHLYMLAYDLLMVNLDAPVNFAHNYYLYQDGSGQFNPIVWDMNENFGGFTMLLGTDGPPTGGADLYKTDIFLNEDNSNFPIIREILAIPKYKRMFVAHVKTIAEEMFADGKFSELITKWQDFIDEEVKNDPNLLSEYSDFRKNASESAGSSKPGPGGSSKTVGLTELMDARVEWINTLDEFKAQAPVLSDVGHSFESTDQSFLTVHANAAGLNSIELMYRQTAFGKYEKIKMTDDGENADVTAGDGIFSANIPMNNSTLCYYIYSENSDAGVFSPERAAYEYHTATREIQASNSVVINELMASNDATVADEFDEYDDWAELYNNSSEAVSLKGWFFSDDEAALNKWEFPDIEIPAKGYLTIWVDKDDEQGDLHTNFKLSAAGEELFLVDPAMTIIDKVIFGEQEKNVSYGRFPNGTGDFETMPPSFGTKNMMSSIQEEMTLSTGTYNYPNPFDIQTKIAFTQETAGSATLIIFNATGQELFSIEYAFLQSGLQELEFDAMGLLSGVYYYRIVSGAELWYGSMSVVK